MTQPNATDQMEAMIPTLTAELTPTLDAAEQVRRLRRDTLRQALLDELTAVFTAVDRNRLNLRIDQLTEEETVVLATFHGRTYRIVRREGSDTILLPPGQSVHYFVEFPSGRGSACSSPADIPVAIVRCHVFAEWRSALA